jgi:hypothetical protein
MMMMIMIMMMIMKRRMWRRRSRRGRMRRMRDRLRRRNSLRILLYQTRCPLKRSVLSIAASSQTQRLWFVYLFLCRYPHQLDGCLSYTVLVHLKNNKPIHANARRCYRTE